MPRRDAETQRTKEKAPWGRSLIRARFVCSDFRADAVLGRRVQRAQVVVTRGLCQASFVLAYDPLGLPEQATDVTPEGFLQPIGTHLFVPAQTLSPEVTGVTAEAPIVGIGAVLAGGGPGTDRFAVVGVSTAPADQQARQQVSSPALPLTVTLAILGQLLLDRRKDLRLDQGRDRDGNLFIHRDIVDRVGPSGLCGGPAVRTQPRPPRPAAGLAVGRPAMVGRVPQETPDRRAIPPGLAGRRRNALVLQPPAHLPQAQPLLAHPRKDLSDHSRLLQNDLVRGVSPGLAGGDIAIPVRRAPERIDRTVSRRMQFASPAALQNLRPFILRHDPLHLHQKLLLRLVPDRMVQERHLHPLPVQLLQQQDLIGALPRQPVRGIHVQPVDQAQRRQVPQTLQGRTHERRPAVAVVDKTQFLVQYQTLLPHPFLQGLHLTGDGLILHLLV